MALVPWLPLRRNQRLPELEVEDPQAAADAAAAAASVGRQTDKNGGGLTPLVFAAREDCIECAKILVEQAKADVNQITHYGWTPLLTATQNRHYKLASYLLEHGANPNLANNGGWTPLYIATDNRNIEGGDYPVRKPDMDHFDFIKLLIAKGANVNARICGKAIDREGMQRGQHGNPHHLHHAMALRGRRNALPASRAIG